MNVVFNPEIKAIEKVSIPVIHMKKSLGMQKDCIYRHIGQVMEGRLNKCLQKGYMKHLNIANLTTFTSNP